MNIRDEVLSLGLPQGSYVIVGSGILAALGIRESNDIDIIVSDATFDALSKQGWKSDTWENQTVLKQGVFDVGRTWSGRRFKELLEASTMVDGIAYLSLAELREWKKNLGREKDLQDIRLIDEYLSSHR